MTKPSRTSDHQPLCWEISPRKPLIILQTSPRFRDAQNSPMPRKTRYSEATKHGREAVRAWTEAVPDDIKPYCNLQMEVHLHDHDLRLEVFRRVFDELERACIPINFQFGEPHYGYAFDPEHAETLIEEYPCIKSLTMAELCFEHYETFNVQRYAMSAETRYAIDVLKMAGRHGKPTVISLQDLKWMHIGSDYLNQPLVDTIREYGDYCVPVNEHIGPRYLARQTTVCGWWLAGLTRNWGAEPQSWWYENARMIEPGLFGQTEPNNTRIMPPDLYRAMILLAAQLGATVYPFEPFWDLFDYDNARCWREHIYPTLMEVIGGNSFRPAPRCWRKRGSPISTKRPPPFPSFMKT